MDAGILASTPRDFYTSDRIRPILPGDSDFLIRTPYTITNKGLHISTAAIEAQPPTYIAADPYGISKRDYRVIYLVPLNRRNISNNLPSSLGSPCSLRNGQWVIALAQNSAGTATRVYWLDLSSQLEDLWNNGKKVERQFFIKFASPNLESF